MNVTHDASTDTLTIVLSDAPAAESDEDKTGVILDYDVHGNLVSIEVLDASTKLHGPRSVTLSACAAGPHTFTHRAFDRRMKRSTSMCERTEQRSL